MPGLDSDLNENMNVLLSPGFKMLLGYKININLLLSSYIMAVESLNTIRVL
jgi:hypothetical protein